ncbi:tetratricopeptide-like helical domain, DYW domain protein [Artemisia annua]|uniref:Tetratricopeptide-like helical domain, DYW domain protein n=1 Tax=Artemisia annua TaxID=35608 RepID=A0A2U1LLB7_ARTAN|nr:tetratricopeptide-like helical domain, DYW domain protein [Artemisia annua]
MEVRGSEIGKRRSSYGSESRVYASNGENDNENNKLVIFYKKTKFELEDLLRDSAEMLGKGSLGTVYSAVSDDGCTVAKCGMLWDARKGFDEMSERAVSWNAMISGCIGYDEYWERVGLFMEMQKGDLKANGVTVVELLKACGELTEWKCGREIHANCLRHGLFGSNYYVGASLMGFYMKFDPSIAWLVFEMLDLRNTISLNTMISGYVNNGDCLKALELFILMLNNGFECDSITMLVVIQACTEFGDLELGLQVHQLLAGFQLSEQTIAIILHICAQLSDGLVFLWGWEGKAIVVEEASTQPDEPAEEPSTPLHLILPTQMSTPPLGQGGRFVHAGRFSEPGNSREGDGLTRVNGKLVRTRGRGDGSRARMYPQEIKPIGYGVSYDPIDGEPMLGMQDVIGIPKPAWPPDDAQVQAEIALTQSQPMPSQENPVQAANEIVQDEDLHEEEPSPLRRSERIKQIIFNKPPAPGPGLSEDDAIEV